ncbi:hypothetical protein FRC12_018640 [Ceratobasidium sp. 428]|nr:hypothetical protein FRC12_018640 [Ceratobasidium sp. 428]
MVSTATVNARNPYSRPSKANLPPPSRPKHARAQDEIETNGDELQNKRPHGLQDQGDSSQLPGSARGFLPNATPGAGSSSSGAPTVQAALHAATRNLAQPRETPGQSQHDQAGPTAPAAPAAQPQNMEIDHEEVLESLQSDHDKVLETLYEDGGNGNVDLVRALIRYYEQY